MMTMIMIVEIIIDAIIISPQKCRTKSTFDSYSLRITVSPLNFGPGAASTRAILTKKLISLRTILFYHSLLIFFLISRLIKRLDDESLVIFFFFFFFSFFAMSFFTLSMDPFLQWIHPYHKMAFDISFDQNILYRTNNVKTKIMMIVTNIMIVIFLFRWAFAYIRRSWRIRNCCFVLPCFARRIGYR